VILPPHMVVLQPIVEVSAGRAMGNPIATAHPSGADLTRQPQRSLVVSWVSMQREREAVR
jgi:hypothetical protein